MVYGKILYSSAGNTRLLAPLAIVVTVVVVLAIIFAMACATVAFEMAEPMAVNAQVIEELKMKSNLKGWRPTSKPRKGGQA
ncbi:hypothetical protein E2C01_069559 [Portunus trituberculatus]|uniref:Uncharacterized protein n=1 Tax=Portunus trituberculatus TaxID=210409 RepID=A0A5B7HZ73_PORTR|nr:hypothetical protein [Portunus trituberculatus]